MELKIKKRDEFDEVFRVCWKLETEGLTGKFDECGMLPRLADEIGRWFFGVLSGVWCEMIRWYFGHISNFNLTDYKA